jgi:hypothetical protein
MYLLLLFTLPLVLCVSTRFVQIAVWDNGGIGCSPEASYSTLAYMSMDGSCACLRSRAFDTSCEEVVACTSRYNGGGHVTCYDSYTTCHIDSMNFLYGVGSYWDASPGVCSNVNSSWSDKQYSYIVTHIVRDMPISRGGAIAAIVLPSLVVIVVLVVVIYYVRRNSSSLVKL